MVSDESDLFMSPPPESRDLRHSRGTSVASHHGTTKQARIQSTSISVKSESYSPSPSELALSRKVSSNPPAFSQFTTPLANGDEEFPSSPPFLSSYTSGLRKLPFEDTASAEPIQDQSLAQAASNQENPAFGSLNSLSEEAAYDPELFIAKHFLDSQGEPDRTKTRLPLALPGLLESQQLVDIAGEVGLLTKEYRVHAGDPLKNESLLILGWNSTMINGAVVLLDAESALKTP